MITFTDYFRQSWKHCSFNDWLYYDSCLYFIATLKDCILVRMSELTQRPIDFQSNFQVTKRLVEKSSQWPTGFSSNRPTYMDFHKRQRVWSLLLSHTNLCTRMLSAPLVSSKAPGRAKILTWCPWILMYMNLGVFVLCCSILLMSPVTHLSPGPTLSVSGVTPPNAGLDVASAILPVRYLFCPKSRKKFNELL